MKKKTKLTVVKPTTLQFKIDRGIQMPPRKKPNPFADVFNKMDVGHSFLIGKDESLAAQVKAQAARYGKENNMTFAFRTTEEGQRCWRVK